MKSKERAKRETCKKYKMEDEMNDDNPLVQQAQTEITDLESEIKNIQKVISILELEKQKEHMSSTELKNTMGLEIWNRFAVHYHYLHRGSAIAHGYGSLLPYQVYPIVQWYKHSGKKFVDALAIRCDYDNNGTNYVRLWKEFKEMWIDSPLIIQRYLFDFALNGYGCTQNTTLYNQFKQVCQPD